MVTRSDRYKHRSSSPYADLSILAPTRWTILVLAGVVFSGCAGYEHSQAVRVEKMAQGERLQHIIDNYRVCLQAKDNAALPGNCAI